MNGISGLIKGAPESYLAHSAMQGHTKKMSSTNQETANESTLMYGFPTSRTVRNKLLLFISHPTYCILL
jgi:hypothetical protein